MADINPSIATDLSRLKGDQVVDLSEAARKQRKDATDEETARRWRHNMKRTFRGVFTDRERMRYLNRYQERQS